MSDDDDFFPEEMQGRGTANALKWYFILTTPFALFHAVTWSVHRRYRARIQATREDRAEKSLHENLREILRELGRSVDRYRVLPLPSTSSAVAPELPQPSAPIDRNGSEHVGVTPNAHMAKGTNRRGPTHSKAAAPPPKYAGKVVAKMGLVVKLSEAIEHWNLGLDGWHAYSERNHAHPTRYEVDGDTPFVMISYNTALKKHGRAAIDSLLQQLQAQGWEYLWWDWMVINDMNDDANYVQAEFESAMTWAQSSAYEVVVLWPKPSDALAYMERPWCLSEILACTSRGAHVVYSQPGDFWFSKDGAGSHFICEKIFFPIMLAANEAYAYIFCVLTTLVLTASEPKAFFDSDYEWIFPLLLSFFLSYCVMFVRYYLNKTLGSGPIGNYQLLLPVDLIEFLTNNNVWKQSHAERIKLVSNLCEAGHLTGAMYDLGDAMGCGALLGYEKPWKFAFEQATLKWNETCPKNEGLQYPSPLLPWLDKNLKRKVAFAGRNASWLNGTSSDEHNENDAVSKSFTGVEMLWLSWPHSTHKEKTLNFWLKVKIALFTPIAPIQLTKITTFLKRPLLIGAGQIRAFYLFSSFLTASAMPVAAYVGGGAALLLSICTLTPHFMMATGYLTLVSRSNLYVFCSMVSLVQVGFLFFQILISALALEDSNLEEDWPIMVLYTFYFLWCYFQWFVAVIYLVYNLFTKVLGMGENTSSRKVC